MSLPWAEHPGATVLDTGANPFVLASDPETVWVVARGYVDLFVVPVADGAPAGERMHVLKMESGCGFCGIAPVDAHAMLVAGSSDVQLVTLSRATVQALLDHAEHGPPLKTVLDTWNTRVTAYLETERVALSPDSGGFYVGLMLQAFDWTSMREKQAAMLAACVSRRRQALEAHEGRLHERARADAEMLDDALRAFAGVITGSGPRAASEVGLDPLQRACRLVGEALGVQVRPPARSAVSSRVAPVEQIARASGLGLRRVVLKDGWWQSDVGPLLGFVDGRPVALLPLAPGRYVRVDPSDRSRVRVDAAVARTLEPHGFTFSRPFPEGPIGGRALLRFVGASMGGDLRTLGAVSLATAVLGLAVPVATGLLMGRLIPSGFKGPVLDLGLALAAFALGGLAFALARATTLLRIQGRLGVDLQTALMSRMLTLPAPFFHRYNTGDLTRRIAGVETIREVLSGSALIGALSAVFTGVSLALMLWYDVRLGLAAICMTAVLAAGLGWDALRLRDLLREQLDLERQVDGRVVPLIRGIVKVRLAGAEVRAFSWWARAFARMRAMIFEIRRLSIRASVFQAFWTVAATAVLMALAVGSVPRATFLALYAAFGQVAAAAQGLAAALPSLLSVGPTLERLQPILTEPAEALQERPDPGVLRGRLDVTDLTFRYSGGGPLVLGGLSLHAAPGEFIAVVGASGCGKSTLLRLLLGFEKPEAGRIRYDGQDLEQVDVLAVRRQIGVVLQTAHLLPGDILNNILGSSTLLTMDDAWEAARIAGLADDIKAMPMGMSTMITGGTSTLSGGQVQRLMIARAVAARPRYLLLDEATSALDNRVQKDVSDCLSGLSVTRVVIAHRLSTVRHSDRIYFLERGEVVQTGTYDELMGQHGPFAEFARRQLL